MVALAATLVVATAQPPRPPWPPPPPCECDKQAFRNASDFVKENKCEYVRRLPHSLANASRQYPCFHFHCPSLGYPRYLSLLFVFARFSHTHLVAPSLAFAQMPRFCDEDCLEGIKKLLNCDW